MPFAWEPVALLRLAAWLALVALGVAVWARRPDGAGRAFALWAIVWGGGIQAVLSLQSMATDAATQGWLYRVDYYAILFCSSAFLALLLYAPERSPRAAPLAALVLAPAALAGLAFAADHGAFLAEGVQDGSYVAPNAGLMPWGYHVAIWTGFAAGMAWLGWRAPRLGPRARGSATWLMAGLALFAADRFARTWTWFAREPGTLPPPPEGLVYAAMMFLFGPLVLWMWLRARGIPEGGNVGRAALAGFALGATALATFSFQGPTAGVLLSALLAPVYGLLLARGVLEAPLPDTVEAREGRAAVLAEA